jgi:peptidyl-prolyl cis-trans isomerase C
MHKTKVSRILVCASAWFVTQQVPAADSNATASAATPANKAPVASTTSIIAKGKGVEVDRSQLDEAIKTYKANAAAQGKSIPPEQLAMMEPGLLDRLIQTQILLSKATDADKAKATEEATKQLQSAKTNAPNEAAFDAELKAMGMTRDKLFKTMTEQNTAEAVVMRELKINVTEADARKFYEDTNNAAKFEQPEMVRASHVLQMTQDPKTNKELPQADKDAKHKIMEGVLKRARAGEDFAKLAGEFSEDPGSKDKGGEYTFPRGQMAPEFEATAFALKTNEISDIFTTQFGYHILKLWEHIPAGKVPFDKVAPRITNYLTQQEFNKLGPDFMAKARKEAEVEILDEKLKRPELPTGALPPGQPPGKAKS